MSKAAFILVLACASGVLSGAPSEKASLWSLSPVRTPAVPQVTEADWAANHVDAFVLARMKQEGLVPGGLADKPTLIRRATFDLTGLPPTPEEIDGFLSDDDPGAYTRLLERLLGSHHYGERWGRHWLDLVRYADTSGDAADFPVPEAYKYRNYVIDAFNSDKPYNQFVREQLAGDLLPSANDETRWERVIATGYVAISRRIGVVPNDLRHITIEDTIDNVGKTFLGLSIGCARCHDHKFDPIPTTDYYALYGILDSSTYPHPGAEHRPHRSDFVYRIGREESDRILKEHREELEVWRRRERAQFEVYRSFQNQKVTDPNLSRESTWHDLLKIRADLAGVAKRFPDLETAYALQEGEAHDVHVMKAGSPDRGAQGERVRRGFLQALGGARLPEDYQGSGRLALAEWIADPANPLTARVMANRIWHYHFGKGLVQTPSDFGVRGATPTHPELLDFLAARFVEKGWSVKEMHRLIMTSRAYRLASSDDPSNAAIDPANDYLWRSDRRRLDAEQLRDSLLMVGGDLDRSVGGRHPFPHHLTYFYRQHDPFQETYPTRQRSVYMLQQRIQKDTYLDTFDGPDGNLHFENRPATTTALQALFMMNSEFIHERSEAIARHLMQQESVPEVRVRRAYRTLFGRPPSEEELERARSYLTLSRSQLGEVCADPSEVEIRAWSGYVRGMIASNEFIFVD